MSETCAIIITLLCCANVICAFIDLQFDISGNPWIVRWGWLLFSSWTGVLANILVERSLKISPPKVPAVVAINDDDADDSDDDYSDDDYSGDYYSDADDSDDEDDSDDNIAPGGDHNDSSAAVAGPVALVAAPGA